MSHAACAPSARGQSRAAPPPNGRTRPRPAGRPTPPLRTTPVPSRRAGWRSAQPSDGRTHPRSAPRRTPPRRAAPVPRRRARSRAALPPSSPARPYSWPAPRSGPAYAVTAPWPGAGTRACVPRGTGRRRPRRLRGPLPGRAPRPWPFLPSRRKPQAAHAPQETRAACGAPRASSAPLPGRRRERICHYASVTRPGGVCTRSVDFRRLWPGNG
ncbi:hypothetical protein FRZ00_00685 [Streptomyces mobaraensis]|uniref:Uncharacterized protein n=1 Tax=Streptomyces mobaraensis TaxID=35621 RepID=A0A5N5WFC9_STRMB|nr:hypothetical protein FRZ00_00685 [Streptomyces mobaraensis]